MGDENNGASGTHPTYSIRPSDPPQSRVTFSSTWGTVLATAGVAIGLGNIWRFPYMMGKHGGAAFLAVYVVIMIAFGIPGLMAEWSLGRWTRRGPSGAMRQAGLPGGRFWGFVLVVTVVMAGSYYGVVIAWVLQMSVAFGVNTLSPHVATDFSSAKGSVTCQLVYVGFTVLAGCGALFLGVNKGIERVSKIALPVFFLLFVVLIVRVLTLDGALDGARAFLTFRWDDVTGRTVLAAMGQGVFSLGLGGTFMVAYGSYMSEDQDIPRNAVLTATADTCAALMAATIVVPAALAFGIPLNGGPPLMFDVMPRIFQNMPAGSAFGAMFFLSIFLVAMLSLIAAYEVVVAAAGEWFGWSRRRVLPLILLVDVVLAIPAILSDAYLENSDLIWGTTMQPVGAVIAIAAIAWCVGRANMLGEIRRHTRLFVPDWLFYWIKFGIPLCIVTTLVYGWTKHLTQSSLK